MTTPSLYPLFMMAQSGSGGGPTIIADGLSISFSDTAFTIATVESVLDLSFSNTSGILDLDESVVTAQVVGDLVIAAEETNLEIE